MDSQEMLMQRQRTSYFAGWACAVSLCLIGGCKPSGPELGEVTGTVTLDGKPVPNAIITFRPQVPDSTTSIGVTNAEGKYTLMYTADRNGTMVGKNDVEIVTNKLTESELSDYKATGKTPPPFVPIPQKYKEPGTLVKDVAAGQNTIDFELKSK